MDYLEIDENLRNLIKSLLSAGYKQTSIGRVLLGPNGYAPLSKFLDEDNGHNFGIKPLNKIGDLLGYKLKLVYIDPKVDQDTENLISNKNTDFFIRLQDGLTSYLNDSKNNNGASTIKKSVDKKTNLDSILEDIINSTMT